MSGKEKRAASDGNSIFSKEHKAGSSSSAALNKSNMVNQGPILSIAESKSDIKTSANATNKQDVALVPIDEASSDTQIWDTDTYKSLPKTSDGRQLRFVKLLLPKPDPADTVPWEVAWRESRLPTVIATRKGLLEPSVHQAALASAVVSENESLLDQGSVHSLLDIVKIGAIKDTDEYGYAGQVNPEFQPHGDGIMLWLDNSRYEGMWENGQRHGYGVMRWPSGDTYAGHWHLDRQFGFGQMVYASDYGPPGHEVFVAGRAYPRDPEDKNHQHCEGDNYIGERCGDEPVIPVVDSNHTENKALVIELAYDVQSVDSNNEEGKAAVYTMAKTLGEVNVRGGGSVTSNTSTVSLRTVRFRGVRDGMGRFLFKNGDYYNGQWINDKMSGMGRLDFKNGDCYVGDFVRNKRDGQGMCTYADGGTYDGAWSDNQREGHGIQWFPNGDRYEGCWVQDAMEGYGIYTLSNGETYKGNYMQGKRHGIGKADYLDGSINQGQWQHDEFLGKKFKPDYDYTGEYNMTLGSHLYAKKHGFGRKVWSDGSKRIYDGQWFGDQMAGYCNAMVNFEGIGSVYVGQLIADGIKHGQGKFTAPNGDVYDGQWSHGKKHGHGSLTFAKTGEVYTGKFFNNQSMRRGG
jgi:hypothetical protein